MSCAVNRTAHVHCMKPNTSPAERWTPTFISTSEAASILCVSRRTLEGWRRKRTGPRFYTFGRLVRYDEHQVLEWAKNRNHGEVA